MGGKLVKQEEHSKEEEAIVFYKQVSYIFIICGFLWMALACFAISMPQDYEKYNIPLFFGILMGIGILTAAPGAVILILLKKSARFREFCIKDHASFRQKHPGYKLGDSVKRAAKIAAVHSIFGRDKN